jgi:16S rRNA (cytosine1402-N4)-methyltransferase
MSPLVHQPVLVAEVLAALRPRAGGRYADLTVGGGGHAAAILSASAPDGWLLGCDRDPVAVAATRERLQAFSGRFELREGSFAEVAAWVAPASLDGVLADLGISSMQLDNPARGFSLMQDGPLDMRLAPSQTLTAAQLVNEAPEDELARILWELGGERAGRRVARAIVRERAQRRLTTTGQLAALIARAVSRAERGIHPATRCFLALRRAVNDEAGALDRGLPAAWQILKPAGRMAIISFHSAEDRQVKEFGRALARDYVAGSDADAPELRRPRPAQARWVNRKAIRPGAAEVAANPRARSAQLRILEKL